MPSSRLTGRLGAGGERSRVRERIREQKCQEKQRRGMTEVYHDLGASG